MSAQQQVAAPDEVEDVASLLIPLSNQTLLVPNVSVAEVVPMGVIEPAEGAPDWLLGYYTWRNLRLPLLSFELLNGDPKALPEAEARIAVFNSTGVSDELPFVAVLAQGLPRLARVSVNELQAKEGAEEKPLALMPVSWAGEQAVIPDITKLEQIYLTYHQNG